MDPSFWQARWKNNEIGFHQSRPNWALERYFDRLSRRARVFVPLAGKSVDLTWILAQGAEVLAIELVEAAVRAYFEESGLTPEVEAEGPLTRFTARGLSFWAGDFFALGAPALGAGVCAYDRAALIALPPEMRARYAAHMRALLGEGAQMLLVTLEYDQRLRGGPPFSVDHAEVARLYSSCERLEARDVLAESPRFKDAGLTSLTEAAYLVRI